MTKRAARSQETSLPQVLIMAWLLVTGILLAEASWLGQQLLFNCPLKIS